MPAGWMGCRGTRESALTASADLGARYPWARSIIALAWPYRPARGAGLEHRDPAWVRPRSFLRLRVHGLGRARRRLSRSARRTLRHGGGLAARLRRGRPREALRRPWMGARSRDRRAGGHRIRRKARVGDHARSRLVRAARGNRGIDPVPRGRALATRLRDVQCVPARHVPPVRSSRPGSSTPGAASRI